MSFIFNEPVVIPNSEFTIDVDTVIMSIGTSPNPLIKSTTDGLEVNRHGGIIVNEDNCMVDIIIISLYC